MSLRCPRCGTAVPSARVFWFIRLFSFPCTSCDARLALVGRARALFVASVAVSIVLSFVVKGLTVSEAPAIIVFVAGMVVSCLLVRRFGALGIEAAGPDDAAR